MAVTQLENFSGVVTDTNLSTVTTPGALGLPGALPALASGGAWVVYQEPFALRVEKVGGKCWLGGGTGYSPTSSLNMYLLNLASLVAPTTKTFVIGYRQKRKLNLDGVSSINVPMFKILTTGNTYSTYAYLAIDAVSTEWYVELVFNRVDNTVAVYKDGRYLRDVAITVASDITQFQNNTMAIGIPVASTSGLYITDIYVVEDTADDTPNGRLGPQDLVDIPLQVTANAGWDVTNLADVFARKDFATDTGKYITGTGDGSVLKLKPVDGYVLPSQSNVSAVMLQERGFYKPGAGGDITSKIIRGIHSNTAATILQPSLVAGDKGTRLVNSSHGADETVPASALNGLEVSLTVVGR